MSQNLFGSTVIHDNLSETGKRALREGGEYGP